MFGNAEKVVGTKALNVAIVGPLSLAVMIGLIAHDEGNDTEALGGHGGGEGNAALLLAKGGE